MVTRPEVTGRKLAPAAYSVREFCEVHGFGLATYYRLKARGEGPDEIHVGSRVLVSIEAAARWRRKRTVKKAATQVA